MTTAATRTADVQIIPTTPGRAVALVGDDTYLMADDVATVRVAKLRGNEYTVKVGTRGCFGCGCKAKKYGRPQCRHEIAGDRFLDAIF